MTLYLDCSISFSPLHYRIDFYHDLLNSSSLFAASIAHLGAKFAIVCNETIAPLYGNKLCQALQQLGLKSDLLMIKDGEKYKTRTTKETLENELLKKSYGRDCCLIALGGGVVMDLAGFIAATFCRGISLVMVPTSLLGMVDAAIGGKTAVNAIEGKNLIGTFYHPKKIAIDPYFLKTLIAKELKNGFAEAIKYGAILDSSFFDYLKEQAHLLLALDLKEIEKMIFKSCQLKLQVVTADPNESGLRHLLNFGHTAAHALEKVTNFEIAHGQAVALGMALEAYLAFLEGYLKKSDLLALTQLLQLFGFSLKLAASIEDQALIHTMSADKKALKRQPRFVMMKEIGAAVSFAGSYCATASVKNIEQAVKWMKNDLCSYPRTDL